MSRLNKWSVPLTLLGVVLLSYGIFIPWYGLFGNDLPYLYHYHLFGPQGPAGFAAVDRPYSAWVYTLTTFLFGENVWLYHLLLLLERWTASLLLFEIIDLTLPGKRWQAAGIAILFALYPGFRQQPVAVEFILHFTILNLFFLSIWWMLLAARGGRRRGWLLSGSGLLALSLFSIEYFAGLELLRPLLLWFALEKVIPDRKVRLKQTLICWTPALVALGVFVFWRVLIFKFPTYQPVILDHLGRDPLAAIPGFVKQVASDLVTVLPLAWYSTLKPVVGGLYRWMAFILAAVVFLWVSGWLVFSSRVEPAPKLAGTYASPGWGVRALLLGAAALILGGAPFWVTGIQIRLEFPWDRPTLPFMLGSSLVIIGLVDILRWRPLQQAVIALLAGLAVYSHAQNAVVYHNEWEKFRQFFWQLTWRAPGLQNGTLVLFDSIPLDRYADTDLTTALNWVYAPDLHERQLRYKFFDLSIRLGEEYVGLPGLTEGLRVEHHHRSLEFVGSTSQMLVVDFTPPACLRILAKDTIGTGNITEKLESVLPLSKPDLMDTHPGQAARPPEAFGREPAHEWCYYYQKAELARQQADWKEVIRLATIVETMGYAPVSTIEWLPFIEGFVRLGDWQKAGEISQLAAAKAKPDVCTFWARYFMDPSRTDADKQAIAKIQKDAGCRP
ncbi:MAG TPA: hypothetical protein VIO61_16965 [Anaerolineaceae bacterium]